MVLTPHGVQNGIPIDKETQVDWERRLASKGWLAYFWPKEYGGPGWGVTQRYIFLRLPQAVTVVELMRPRYNGASGNS